MMHFTHTRLIIYRTCIFLGLLTAFTSFWLGSRFTVDDAFITWRFGKNLVDNGIWNYNPSTLDLTQAYTNPIFAFLSIIPAYLHIDIVFFFKIVSTGTLIAFIFWFLKQTKNSIIMLLLLLSMPATILHTYGGLETFLFVFLVSALLIALEKKQTNRALISTLILFLTRPEAWTLVVLVPLYLAITNPESLNNFRLHSIYDFIKKIRINFKKLIFTFLALALPLGGYFLFHFLYFGNALPHTFYAKAGVSFAINEFVKFSFFISPLFLLLIFKRIKTFIFSLLFFIPIVLSYSKSYLMMDYASRFAFHLFIPVFCYLVYLAGQLDDIPLDLKRKNHLIFNLSKGQLVKLILIIFILIFAKVSGIRSLGMFNYFPRLLNAQSELGKVLSTISDKYKIGSFLIGDAGVAAFHSNLNVMDHAGLGSASVIKKGISPDLLNHYKVDLIAFYATPEAIQWSYFSQNIIHEWATKNKLNYICDIYWRPDYTFKIYTKENISEILSLCAQSKSLNDMSESEFFKNNKFVPPWYFWKT